ncbi:MAG: cohesin domain-containing protein, partial [Planctomycetota bacterium]
VPDDLEGVPGEIVYVPVFLDNSVAPVEVSSVSVGIQFDASILEPLGVGNSELTLGQADAQVRFASSDNTISVSVDNFSTVESGALLDLIFMVRPEASIGSASTLTMLTPTLNGAIVPGTDGLVTVVIASR